MGFFANSQSGLDRIRNTVKAEERDAKVAAKKSGKKIPSGKPGNRSASQLASEVMNRSGALKVIRGG